MSKFGYSKKIDELFSTAHLLPRVVTYLDLLIRIKSCRVQEESGILLCALAVHETTIENRVLKAVVEYIIFMNSGSKPMQPIHLTHALPSLRRMATFPSLCVTMAALGSLELAFLAKSELR